MGDYFPPPLPPASFLAGQALQRGRDSHQIKLRLISYFCFNKQRNDMICVLELNAMKMKGILTTAIVCLLALSSWAQTSTVTNNEVTYFGQCMVEVQNDTEMRALEAEMRTNPYIKMCRLDYNTQRAFILTKSTETLTEEQFTSWFIGYSDKVRCVQVGVHGVDQMKPYPFVDCIK